MNPDFAGHRIAFVTGASRGIGRASALALAQRGYAVLATGRDRDALAQTEASLREIGPCMIVAGDLAAADGVETVGRALDELSRLDVAIHAAGGAYIDRMSDYCGDCRFDRRRRTGPDACPFTTLYWDFIARHGERFSSNRRMAQQVRGAERLADLGEVRERAAAVLVRLDAGEL